MNLIPNFPEYAPIKEDLNGIMTLKINPNSSAYSKAIVKVLDILMDILKEAHGDDYLNRNDIELFQLVNDEMDGLIEKGD